MRKKRKNRAPDEVQLNLAAMLDMAFQLLAFFILTFKPAPVEGDVLLRMPPPESMVVRSGKSAGQDTASTDPLRGLDTLKLAILATNKGDIGSIQVEDAAIGNNMARLNEKLQSIIGSKDSKFTQVLIGVDRKLKYEGLMQVVDVCTRQKLPDGSRLGKLSFIDMGGP